jgi:hypothetical protein
MGAEREEDHGRASPRDSGERALIEGRATLSELDFYEASAFIPRFRGVRNVTLLGALFFAQALVVTLLADSDRPSSGAPHDHYSLLLPLAVPPTIVLFVILLLRRRWSRQQSAEFGAGPISFSFDEVGINVASALRQVRVAWAERPRQVKTPKGMLVFVKSRARLFVPRRAFVGEDVWPLQRLLDANLRQRRDWWRGLEIGMTSLLALSVFLSLWHFFSVQNPPQYEPERDEQLEQLEAVRRDLERVTAGDAGDGKATDTGN